MPGEEKVTTSSQYPTAEQAPKEPDVAPVAVEEGVVAHFRRVIQVLAIAAVVATGFYLWLYFQTEDRPLQLLAEAGFVGLALASIGLAYLLLRRNKTRAAGYLALLGLIIAYGGGELVFGGATWYIAVGGILLILLAGSIVLPRQWGAWIILAVSFGLYVWLVNRFEPIPRYDVAQSVWLNAFIPGITVALGLGVIWQIIRAFRIGTIRARLLIAFTGVVLLTALLISLGAILLGFENGRQEVISQLEAAATFKEAEIETWTETLQSDLDVLLAQVNPFVENKALIDLLTFSQSTRQDLRAEFDQMMELTTRFEELFLLDPEGQVIVSTDPLQEGKIHSDKGYFLEGQKGPYLHPPIYFPSLGQMSIIVARPVLSQDGQQLLGVLAGRANLDRLNEIMLERTGAGETGETYLVGSNKALLTESRFPGYEPRRTYVRSEGAIAAIENYTSGAGLYQDYRDVPVIGVYRWLPDLQVALFSEQDQAEAFESIYEGLLTNVGIALGAGVIAILLSLFVTGTISTPLSQLAQTATRIAAGDLTQEVKLEREDEIGELSQAFNSMTEQLRELIESLEARVLDRTQRLEIVAVLSERLSAILQLDELLVEVVNSVKNNFGYYHAHIYLLDDKQENLVVTAGTGEAGTVMKASGHSISLNAPTSLVAQAARSGQVVRVDNVRQDENWLPNPLLPDTYAEMAVPIILSGQVVGVLDVQEDEVAGLDEGDANLLRSLANQVAVTIRNARLFAEVEQALAEAQAAHERYISQSWQQARLTPQASHYHYTQPNVPMLAGSTLIEAKRRALAQGRPAIIQIDDGETGGPTRSSPQRKSIVAPVTLRNNPIGALQLHPLSDDRSWHEDDLAIVEAIVDELAQMAENLRLFEETRERAGREQTIREVTDKLRAAPSLDILLETAARELGQHLGVPHTVLELGIESKGTPASNGEGEVA